MNDLRTPFPTVVLVDGSDGQLHKAELQRLARALTVQVQEHLAGRWLVAPVIITADVPDTNGQVWPITVFAKLRAGSQPGFHLSGRFQPYANIDLSQVGDDWTIVVSHELL